MRGRDAILCLAVTLALNGCATYVPPPPPPPEAFSRDLDASYSATWAAVTYVAGASFFQIKAFEKASGLMTLDFDLKDVLPYVDCGSAVNTTTHMTTPALGSVGLSALSLSGTANINIMERGPKRTAIQFNSHYTLDGYIPDGYGHLVKAVEWNFTSATADTQPVFGVAVTCRPSYKIERDFLSEVSARI